MVRKSKDKTRHEADTVGYMPERFVEGYFELVRLGLQVDPHGQVFDNESGSPKKKYQSHSGGLKDEAALRFKAWVDRQLRAIGRDVQAYLNARDSRGPSPIGMDDTQRRQIARELERKTELKCHDCGNYVSWQWAFCAWCGKEVKGGKEVSKQGDGGDGQSGGSTSESTPAAHREQQLPGQAGEDASGENGREAGPDTPRADGDSGSGG